MSDTAPAADADSDDTESDEAACTTRDAGPPPTEPPLPGRAVDAVVAAIALGIGAIQVVRAAAGGLTPHPDFASYWHPVAVAVADGADLYAGAWDNKPPLFQFLNLGAHATGAHHAALLAAVAAANAATAVLLARWARRRGHPTWGAVAGGVYALALLPANGYAANVRSFAVLGVLVGLLADRAAVRGTALAAAALCSQYAVLGVPFVAWLAAERDSTRTSLVRAGGWFAAAVAAGYLAVAAVWGSDALAAGVRATLGFTGTYVLDWGPSVLVNRDTWLRLLAESGVALAPLFVLAGVGAVVSRPSRPRLWRRCCVGAVLFASPLLVRPIQTYWVYALPFLSVLAAAPVVADAAPSPSGPPGD